MTFEAWRYNYSVLRFLLAGAASIFLTADKSCADSAAVSGGDLVRYASIGDIRYRVHVYTNVGDAVFSTDKDLEVEYLVVGGGGAGGYGSSGGGGGGGAVLFNSAAELLRLKAGEHPVTVGAGGAGGVSSQNAGSLSRLASVEAAGGGGGGSVASAVLFKGGSGSSGGGGAGRIYENSFFGYAGEGLESLGFDGGRGDWTAAVWSGGGGGGAGGPGADGKPGRGGDGGPGIACDITGETLWFGGGGGGSCIGEETQAGRGGAGGGADGLAANGTGPSGLAGTGGGGSGGNAGRGGNGGSGIVIVRYPAPVDVQVDEERGTFTIKTDRLSATFADGVIVGMENLITGETIADAALNETHMPKGMGHISGDVETMAKIHYVWGEPKVNPEVDGGLLANYHHPGEKSIFSHEKTASGLQAEWKGLHVGETFHPDEVLRIEAGVDEKGALAIRASATSTTGGVFGVTVPLANIVPEAQFYFPSFGGMRFNRKIKPAFRTYGGAPFYEAPVMAAEVGQGSFALWKEDPQFHERFTFFNWTGRSFGFAFEHLNLMPFDNLKKVESVTWKLDTTDGGWMKAMLPYRDWYWKHFAEELKVRDGAAAAWADKIGVVMDGYTINKPLLDRIAELFKPETVMFHEWNARAPDFGKELPDWTPRAGYIDKVKILKFYGFRTMAYVCTYCAVYNSPFWKRDNLSEKFLTRKLRMSNYGKASDEWVLDNLIGDVQGVTSTNQFAKMKDGRFLYGDPLHPGWRDYHAANMKLWNTTTGTDANYEDTAGTSGDFGNGVVDGLFGAQGSVAMMQKLLDTQPSVAMSSEYGPDTIAFGVKWPMVGAQVWGSDAFREYRKHVQVPVNTWLFGYRTWISMNRVATDFLKHVITACSDAAGGMGMVNPNLEMLNVRSGFSGHLVWRAKLFANRGLKPWFDPQIREQDLVCMYRDNEGGLYRYKDDGKVQRMIGPDGKDLYARVEYVDSLETGLTIPDWPATDGKRVFGLNPKARYALFPADYAETPAIRLKSLTEGIAVQTCRQTEGYALLVLKRIDDNVPEKVTVPVILDRAFAQVSVNGRTTLLTEGEKEVELDCSFPAHILFSAGAETPELDKPLEEDLDKLVIRKISLATGIQENTEAEGVSAKRRTMRIPGIAESIIAMVLHGGSWESSVDFLVRVPDGKTSAKVYTRNCTKVHGDGTIAKIYVNGKLEGSIDGRSPNPEWYRGAPRGIPQTVADNNFYEFVVPLGEYAGTDVLITIASDPKRTSMSDNQWVSIPVLFRDDAQESIKRAIEVP